MKHFVLLKWECLRYISWFFVLQAAGVKIRTCEGILIVCGLRVESQNCEYRDIISQNCEYKNLRNSSTSTKPKRFFMHKCPLYSMKSRVPGGQEFHFPHFARNFHLFFFLFFLKLSSFLPSRWATRQLGKALVTPLFEILSCILFSTIFDA